MKKNYLAIIAILSMFSAVTVAGFIQPAPVLVTLEADGSGTAHGDMVTARFADNDVEMIGCGTRVYDDGAGGVFHWGFCQARDEMDTQAFCSTMRSDLVDIMKATSDQAYVTFAWNADGECTHIGFSTQSFYIPEPSTKTNNGNGKK